MVTTRQIVRIAAAGLAAVLLSSTAQLPVQAATPQPTAVSDVPSRATPDVHDGTVYAIGQQGSRTYLGGDFTNASSPGDSTNLARANILAFGTADGVIDPGFTPALDGEVDAIIPGPDNTIYVAGVFKSVNGTSMRVARLNAATGAVVPGWKPPAFSAATTTLALNGSTLYVGGTFAKVAGAPHAGLVALNATTGALLPWLDIDVANHHGTGSARGPVGPKKIVVTDDGTKMVVIGNFTSVTDPSGTVDRDQIFLVDLVAGTSAAVDRGWRTLGYTSQCFNWAFDAYIRDVDLSPDNSYFVVVATGGSGTNVDGSRSLCDTAARFELPSSGTNVQPTWVDYTGQDSLWSVAVTGTAVYVGGHQRWLNNSNGYDAAGSGAVPRPGVGALDPLNGVPLAWNPGRNPRGAGAFALLATPDGLYVGSDTLWIGNYKYRRERVAFFPLAGGKAPVPTSTGRLPGTVYSAGSFANAHPEVLYRVNTGGGAIGATDGGPDWAADNSDPSALRNSGSNAAGWSPSAALDSTIPSSTPSAVFDSERWDPADSNEMQWSLPVPSGVTVTVRLYFANRCGCTASVGQRKFNVDVEGVRRLTDFDIVAATGGTDRATMRSWSVTSDGAINISFGHVVENPLINAIEIVQTDPPVPPPSTNAAALTSRTLDASGTAGPSQVVDSSVMDWSTVRGAFELGDTLYYARTDGSFAKRTFDGTTLGAETVVEPYLDADWSDVQTGSGQTYRGARPDILTNASSLSSLFYDKGRVYYTYSGDSRMYSRAFSPDAGIFGSVSSVVSDGRDWSSVAGAFLAGDTLYFASRTDGALRKVAWSAGQATGSSTVVDSSSSWATRSMFLLSRSNQPPTASFTVSCPSGALACSFDAGASNDPDGSIASYSWDFGDGTTGTGATTTHTYGDVGDRTVTLTVTDGDGATASTTRTAAVVNQAPVAKISVTCGDGTLSCSFDAGASADPDGSIASYTWDFGDGSTATTTTPTADHGYSAPGLYPATVTVTDQLGATDTATANAAPTAAHAQTGFRASSSATASAVTRSTLTIPATVQAGDTMVLFETVNVGTSVTSTDPAGWTLVGTRNNSTAITTKVYTRVAQAGDAGSTVVVDYSAKVKVTASVAAYTGVDTVTPVGVSASNVDSGTSTHTTPTVTVPQADSWVLSYWVDKSSTPATSWSTPGDVSRREAEYGSSVGAVSAQLADSGGPVAAGAYPAHDATVDTSSTKGLSWVISLDPAS
ncbi:MAG: PKD domain-containing protein [Angustibacter sp.]